MARFHFTPRSAAPRGAAGDPAARRRLHLLCLDLGDAALAGPAALDDAQAQGPGWFESSWELVRGLDVREGLPADLRLLDWLDASRRSASPDGGGPAGAAEGQTEVAVAGPVGAAAAEAGVDASAGLDAFEVYGIDGLALV